MEIPPRPAARTPWWRRMTPWALLYFAVVAYIVFWPTPSDFGLSPWLRRIAAVVPAFTPVRVEFAANVLLFVPLGIRDFARLSHSRLERAHALFGYRSVVREIPHQPQDGAVAGGRQRPTAGANIGGEHVDGVGTDVEYSQAHG